MNKACGACGAEKPLEDFHKRSDSKDGFRNTCKKCTGEKMRKWSKANRDRCHEYGRKWREANPEKSRECERKWRDANPEKVRENGRKWREANPERIREKNRKWRTDKATEERFFAGLMMISSVKG
jgi:hypothetical protein